MSSLPQKLLAEFIGTFILVFIGAGSICADAYQRSAGGPGIGLLGIAVAFGLAVAVAASSIGHISGGHINPAVTIAFWVTKRMDTVETLLYWAAQIAGASAAAYALIAVVPDDAWRAAQLGTPDLTREYTRTTGMIIEAIGTFLLVFVVFATAVDERGAFGKVAALPIGMAVTMIILVVAPFTGAALNPARALGPAFASSNWANHGVYWVGPLAGGVLAGWLYQAVFLRKSRVQAEIEPPSAPMEPPRGEK